jgi:hypothetical protein
MDSPRERDPDQHADLERGGRQRNKQVADYEQPAWNRRCQQFGLCAADAVDYDAQPGEHRVQRNQEADRPDRDEGLVARARLQRRLQRRRDHEREHDRRYERDEQLARGARGELEATSREGCERTEGARARPRDWKCDFSGGHFSPLLGLV